MNMYEQSGHVVECCVCVGTHNSSTGTATTAHKDLGERGEEEGGRGREREGEGEGEGKRLKVKDGGRHYVLPSMLFILL